jgi:PAS domain S-box-containing protein
MPSGADVSVGAQGIGMAKSNTPRHGNLAHLQVFANTADGVFAVDQGGRVVLWNKAASRILGFQVEEALGRRCCDVMSGLDVSGNLICYPGCQVMVLSARQQPIHHFDMCARRKDGQETWINISTIVVPADGDQPAGTVHLFRELAQPRHAPARTRPAPTGTGTPARDRGMEARAASPGGLGKSPAASLTSREREILRLLAGGLTTSAIAEKLCISTTTVRNHIQHTLAKLGAHSRLEAVTVVFGQDLLATNLQ